MSISGQAWPAERPNGSAIDYRALVQDDRVHSSLYTNAAIFEDEMQRIFRDGWVYVCHESEVPDPRQLRPAADRARTR